MMILRYYSNNGGWRFGVLYHDGRKHFKVLDTATLSIVNLDNKRDTVPYTKIKPKTLINRIKKRRAVLKRCGVGFPKVAVEKALMKLGEMA